MGEEDESDRCNGTAASGGGHSRGGSGNVSVSREWQAGQDERRSKEWRQVRHTCGKSSFQALVKNSPEKSSTG